MVQAVSALMPVWGGRGSTSYMMSRFLAKASQESQASDIVLMSRVAAGDQRARRELARRVLPRVRRVVQTLVRGAADVDDAVQLSLIEVLRCAPTYRGEGSLDRWARSIAVRTSLSYVRERQRKWKLVDPDADVSTVPSLMDTARDPLPRSIHEYLDQIPVLQRTVLVLRYGLGYSIQEIASLTHAPIDTVKSRLQMGRQKLRSAIVRDRFIHGEKAP